MVQITLIDFYNQKVCMIDWVNGWTVCRLTQLMQDMIHALAVELQAELDVNNQGDTISETGSTAAPHTIAGEIWQAPSSSGGSWSSSSSTTSGLTAASSSWNVVPTGQLESVPEIDDED